MSREKKNNFTKEDDVLGAKKIDVTLLSVEERTAVEARRAYKKAWRAANKDRVAEYNRRFWLKKAAEMNVCNANNKS